jgi:hypothetical protein
MNVRMRSMSVLLVVLPFLLVATLTHSLSLARERATSAGSAFFVGWTASQIDDDIASRL